MRTASKTVFEEAVDWMLLQTHGVLSEKDRILFERWLEKDRSHQEAYRNVVHLQAVFNRYVSVHSVASRERRWMIVRRLRRFRMRVLSKLSVWHKPLLMCGFLGVVRLNNLLIGGLICIVAVWIFVSFPHVGEGDYATGLGESRVIRLANGGQLHMAAMTNLSVFHTKSGLHIQLQRGQLFYEAATDSSPLTIRSQRTFVKLFSGALEVHQRPGDVEVSLLHGGAEVFYELAGEKVEEASSPQSRVNTRYIRMQAGERVVNDNLHGMNRVFTVADHDIGDWRFGWLTFQEVSLAKVLFELGRYYPQHFIVARPETAYIPITLSVNIEEWQDVLSQVVQTAGLTFEWAGHGGVIKIQ